MKRKLCTFLVAVSLLISLLPGSARAAGSGTAILYLLNGDAGVTLSAVQAGAVSAAAGLPGVGLYVEQNGTRLSFVQQGTGQYQLSSNASGVTLLTSGSDGCVRLTGLDDGDMDYSFQLAEETIPANDYVPTYSFDTTRSGNTLYGLMNLYSRQIHVQAVGAGGTGLNGAVLQLCDAATYAPLSFVETQSGVYRMARDGEAGVTELTTATVQGMPGTILVDGLPFRSTTDEDGITYGLPLFGRFLRGPQGYGLRENISDRWLVPERTVNSDLEARVLELGTATFGLYANETPASANPAAQIGYGAWKLDPSVSDEFNDGFLDRSRWNLDWNDLPHQGVDIPNGQVDANGYLELQSILYDGGIYGTSIGSFYQAGYGYYEARFRCPYVPSLDAFWLNTTHDGNAHNKEIDIVENNSSSKLNTPDDNLGYIWQINSHDWDAIYPYLTGDGVDYEYSPRGTRERRIWYPGQNEYNSCSDNFYTYGCLYEPDKLTYYLNGQVVYVDYVQSSYRTFNLGDLGMQIIFSVDGYWYGANSYTQTEYNTALRDDGSGLRINTLYLDYFRYYARTDTTYQDVPYKYSDDGSPASVAQTPQASLPGNWTYNAALSDEFDDNLLDLDYTDQDFINSDNAGLWQRVHNTVSEHGTTLRVPVEIYDPYAADHPIPLPSNEIYYQVFSRNSENYITGSISTKVQDNIHYGDGYYEFRGKAADCDHKSVFELRGSTGQLSVELFGDPIAYTDWTNMVRMSASSGETVAGQTISHTSTNTADAYHIYGVLVKGSVFTLYIDGVEAGKLTTSFNLGTDVTATFSTEGDTSNTGETLTRLRDGRDTTFYVDYLRYYEESGGLQIVPDSGRTYLLLRGNWKNESTKRLTLRDADGRANSSAQWSIVPGSAAAYGFSKNCVSVDASGTLTALQSGICEVSAQVGDKTTTAVVVVPGDYTRDGKVNTADVTAALDVFAEDTTVNQRPFSDAMLDLTGDGKLTLADISVFFWLSLEDYTI